MNIFLSVNQDYQSQLLFIPDFMKLNKFSMSSTKRKNSTYNAQLIKTRHIFQTLLHCIFT